MGQVRAHDFGVPREGLQNKLMEWINLEVEGPSILWVHGVGGSGKSFLLDILAKHLRSVDRLAASFIFQYSQRSESEGDGLIPTLVWQIMHTFPMTRPHIDAYIASDPTIFDRSRRIQMDCLFVKPLIAAYPTRGWSAKLLGTFVDKLRSKKVARPVIIIDELDQCRDAEVACDLLRIFAGALLQLPIPFQLMIGSRPTPQIKRTFDYDLTFRQPINVEKLCVDATNPT